MKRRLLRPLLLLCALLIGNTAVAEGELSYLTVTSGGAGTSYELEKITGISFVEDNLVLSFDASPDVVLPLDNVEKLTFTAQATGVAALSVRQQGIRLEGSTLHVDTKEAAAVSIYTLDGKLVRQQQADSTHPVGLSGIQPGAYVVKVNGESTKILKK